MIDSLFEVFQDQALGLYAVRPVTGSAAPWMVCFTSDTQAKRFLVALTVGNIFTPEEKPKDYSQKGEHPNGRTKLFTYSGRTPF